MSSSAFTPSTTTVTNNVPVNVPVVTAWEAYTPTYASGTITGTTLSGFWRRTGDTLETKIRIQGSAASSLSASTTSINYLPTGLTVDSTKLSSRPSDRGWTSTGMCFGSFDNSVYNPCMLEIENPATTARVLVLKTSNVSPFAATNFTALSSASFASTALNAADRFMEFHLSVPISQWSGSGTTTLATRAVEEYAWNSSTSTTTDTTSFGNGPDGVNIRAFAPPGNSNIEKRVRFQTPIQATDRISLEFNNGAGWALASDISGAQTTNDAGTVSYGQLIRPVSGSTTDFSVFFNSANTGQSPWSGLTSWKWRVRKVSSGAQVGFPVSARNIVGDTSGSVVPTGMLGEVLTFTARGGLVTTGGWRIPDTSPLVTLTAGSWMIYGRLLNTVGIAAGTTSMTGAISNSSVAGTGVGVPAVYGRLDNAFVAAGSGLEAPLSVNYVTVSQGSTLPLYAQFISSGANNTINISGYAIRIA